MEQTAKHQGRYARRTREEIEELIGEYRKSGLTQRAFAEQRGLRYSTFTGWLRKRRRRDAEAPDSYWVELPTLNNSLRADYCLEWPGGVKLHVGRGFDEREVRQLAQTIGETCLR